MKTGPDMCCNVPQVLCFGDDGAPSACLPTCSTSDHTCSDPTTATCVEDNDSFYCCKICEEDSNCDT